MGNLSATSTTAITLILYAWFTVTVRRSLLYSLLSFTSLRLSFLQSPSSFFAFLRGCYFAYCFGGLVLLVICLGLFSFLFCHLFPTSFWLCVWTRRRDILRKRQINLIKWLWFNLIIYHIISRGVNAMPNSLFDWPNRTTGQYWTVMTMYLGT